MDYTAFCNIRCWGFFRGQSGRGVKLTAHLPFKANDKNCGAITTLPMRPHGVELNELCTQLYCYLYLLHDMKSDRIFWVLRLCEEPMLSPVLSRVRILEQVYSMKMEVRITLKRECWIFVFLFTILFA